MTSPSEETHEPVPANCPSPGLDRGRDQDFSFQSLREVVRPVSPKLAHELTVAIQSGSHIVDPVGLLRGTDYDQDMYQGDI